MTQATTNLANLSYEIAWDKAVEDTAFTYDTKYGCGASFVTVKWGKFTREMKELGLAKKDSYYGWILETNEPFMGTLEQEAFNQTFAKRLNELEPEAHAFVHTRLN